MNSEQDDEWSVATEAQSKNKSWHQNSLFTF